MAYPIEVQLWCGEDYYFNIWSHQYVYKYRTPEIGTKLYEQYRAKKIRTKDEFLSALHETEV
ncbi:hypothetical protein DW779_05490 [Clostridium sp. AM30-24]|nr:hypothetical protein DWV71_00175 [Clostridium sp. AF12-28]RHS26396.1 hypothetical protein DWV69_12340 [Clostridium sp. AF12-19]RHT43439.1 hypothetical protein DW779_05490 [Clostridium sp. AM30-24]